MNRPVLLCLAAAAFAGAAHAEDFVDQARVRSVQPQYESVQVPRQECASQWVNEARPVADTSRNYGGAVVGGVAGALLGNQVGRGHGREAATAVGAAVGAITGDQIANANRPPAAPAETVAREVRTCRTVNDVQSRLSGYRVDYEYRGNQYTTMLREHPGQTLPVRVSIVPMEREYHRR